MAVSGKELIRSPLFRTGASHNQSISTTVQQSGEYEELGQLQRHPPKPTNTYCFPVSNRKS